MMFPISTPKASSLNDFSNGKCPLHSDYIIDIEYVDRDIFILNCPKQENISTNRQYVHSYALIDIFGRWDELYLDKADSLDCKYIFAKEPEVKETWKFDNSLYFYCLMKKNYIYISSTNKFKLNFRDYSIEIVNSSLIKNHSDWDDFEENQLIAAKEFMLYDLMFHGLMTPLEYFEHSQSVSFYAKSKLFSGLFNLPSMSVPSFVCANKIYAAFKADDSSLIEDIDDYHDLCNDITGKSFWLGRFLYYYNKLGYEYSNKNTKKMMHRAAIIGFPPAMYEQAEIFESAYSQNKNNSEREDAIGFYQKVIGTENFRFEGFDKMKLSAKGALVRLGVTPPPEIEFLTPRFSSRGNIEVFIDKAKNKSAETISVAESKIDQIHKKISDSIPFPFNIFR